MKLSERTQQQKFGDFTWHMARKQLCQLRNSILQVGHIVINSKIHYSSTEKRNFDAYQGNHFDVKLVMWLNADYMILQL